MAPGRGTDKRTPVLGLLKPQLKAGDVAFPLDAGNGDIKGAQPEQRQATSVATLPPPMTSAFPRP